MKPEHSEEELTEPISKWSFERRPRAWAHVVVYVLLCALATIPFHFHKLRQLSAAVQRVQNRLGGEPSSGRRLMRSMARRWRPRSRPGHRAMRSGA